MTGTTTIAALNDAFRKEPFSAKGKLMVTAGIKAEGEAFVARVLEAMRDCSHFTKDNDPHGEHDFGVVEIDGRKIFWKFDYYDNALKWGSEDPANDKITNRVLTVMFSQDY